MLQVLGKGGRPSSAISSLVLMTQPNDRHEATLAFTYDGYRRLRGPFLL